jgi:hypothetical protein
LAGASLVGAPDFFGTYMGERRRGQRESPEGGSRREKVTALLSKIEEQMETETKKATLADFIRLAQLERDLEEEEQPREVIVRWEETTESEEFAG